MMSVVVACGGRTAPRSPQCGFAASVPIEITRKVEDDEEVMGVEG
jgi:hypothetical protein